MEKQKNLEQVIDDAKTNMEAKVEDLKTKFAHYQEQYYKMEGLCEGFRVTSETLKAENDLYRSLFARVQEFIQKDDFEGLKRTLAGLSIKL